MLSHAFTKLAPLLLVTASPDREVVDRVAAVIESDVITVRELEKKAEQFVAELTEIADPQEREKKRAALLRRVLDIEIGEKMVEREIRDNQERLGVAEADVDKAVALILEMNKISEEQLQAALYGQGMTWSEYRAKLKKQIARDRLVHFRLQGRIQIRDTDVQQRCIERQATGQTDLEVCASHILLTIPEAVPPEEVEKLRVRASKLQAELQSGADFPAYALKHTQDPAAPDGSLGCFGRGQMVEAFERAAFTLEIGGVSPVVRTPFGFHIIKVTDRRHPAQGSCAEPSELKPFREELYQEQMQQQMEIWVHELRRKAFVDVRI